MKFKKKTHIVSLIRAECELKAFFVHDTMIDRRWEIHLVKAAATIHVSFSN